MNIKEAYIEDIICHRYSKDPVGQLISHKEIGIQQLDQEDLTNFFLKPFVSKKREYVFSNKVDLKYNVVYQTCIDILEKDDFVTSSINLFKHLVDVSTSPTVKSGNVFVIKFEDILIDNSYFEAIGIYKIENIQKFYETEIDDGNISLVLKNGFGGSKLDKGALIVLEDKQPIVYLAESNKDAKFWEEDFLGVSQKLNNFSNTENLSLLCRDFISSLSNEGRVSKAEGIDLINKCNEFLSNHSDISINEFSEELFNDNAQDFLSYRKAVANKDNLLIGEHFEVEKKGIQRSKRFRTLKLDDKVEITLLKSGDFIERGYDENRNNFYYKFYFNKEE